MSYCSDHEERTSVERAALSEFWFPRNLYSHDGSARCAIIRFSRPITLILRKWARYRSLEQVAELLLHAMEPEPHLFGR